VLVEKYYKEHSVSRGWNHSPRHRLAALLACAREIHSAKLKLKETLKLYTTLIRIGARLMLSIRVKETRAKH
jgi:hypothetical protein